jgi:acyl-coenzyme A thioesterase PaaI-like protein
MPPNPPGPDRPEAPATRQWQAAADDDPRVKVVRDYADATRRTIDQLMTTTAPEDAVAEAVALLERANTLLAGQPHGRRYEGVAESSMAPAALDPAEERKPFLDFSPVVGQSNPLAPPMQPEMGDGEIRATVTYGAAYEGPPGCVHGGHIAAGFDEVLGFAQTFSGRAGMTGHLQVWYRKPTPLGRPLLYRGWLEDVSGRKIRTRGTLHAGDVLTAEAEGLFIAVEAEVFLRLMRSRPV